MSYSFCIALLTVFLVTLSNNCMTPDEQLVHAVEIQDIDLAQDALTKGASPNALDKRKDSCLYKAAEEGLLEFVELLLSKGANPDLQCYLEYSPLHRAARKGHLQVVQALLKAKANLNIKDRSHMTPLHDACCASHIKVAELLLNAKANPFVKTKYGQTPLDAIDDLQSSCVHYEKSREEVRELLSEYMQIIKTKASAALLSLLKRASFDDQEEPNYISQLPNDMLKLIADYATT